MSDLTGLFDALYSRLLLRDFFGKVVPGTVIIASICVSVFEPADVGNFVQSMTFLPALVLVGFAWITAFAVQAIGEVTGLIRYHNYDTNAEFYARMKRFIDNTDAQEHQQLERLVVIKEACGNGYLALLLGAVLLSLDVLVTDGFLATVQGAKSHWYEIAFVVGLIVSLAKMHRIHVDRQTEYMDAIDNPLEVYGAE